MRSKKYSKGLHTLLTPEQYKIVKKMSIKSGKSIGEIIRYFIDTYVSEMRKENGR